MRLLVFIFVASLKANSAAVSERSVVRTVNGNVQGMVKKYHGTDVYQYTGIPFAAPPVGDLRFKKSEVPNNWNETYDATKFGPSCMQHLYENDKWLIPNKDISEDCLHLNVYVPRKVNASASKAVMVWIHGGGFIAGQGMLTDASYIALQGDVIVVTINYRLGLFGFLSTEDDNAKGNYGLYDQKLAIEWVKANIEHFGGNQSKICIFGESAGGYSVGLLSMSPLNKGLFQRAISESGAVFSPRALAKQSKGVAINAGRLLNCTTSTTKQLVACLKSRKATDLLNIQDTAIYGSVTSAMNFVNRLGPVIDGELIVGDPVEQLKYELSESFQMFRSIDILAGTNNAEGGLLYFQLKQYERSYNFNISEGVPAELLCNVIAPAIARDYYNGNVAISQAICDKYTVSDGSLSDQGRSALNIYADIQFIIPTVKTNMAHSNMLKKHPQKNTFHYIFTHQPSFPWIQERPPWLQGANHAGEVPFVFGIEGMYPETSRKPEEELELSKQMMIYWTNFAKSGNPNVPNNTGPYWPPYTNADQDYLNITIPPAGGRHLFKDRVDIWRQLSTKGNTNGDTRTSVSLLLILSAVLLTFISYNNTL